MVELAIRLVLAALAPLVAYTIGADVELWGKIAGVSAALSIFAFILDRRNLRTPQAATLMAAVDAALVGYLLASAGVANSLAFLVLAPCVYAIRRLHASEAVLAPLAAASMFAGNAIASKTPFPEPMLVGQALGVIAILLLMPPLTPSTDIVPAEPNKADLDITDDYIQLRENYRKLRDSFQEMERRTRKDRVAGQLAELCSLQGERLHQKLVKKLSELIGADDIALYTLAQFDDSMVVRATTSNFPKTMADEAIVIDPRVGAYDLLSDINRSVKALRTDDGTNVANVLLLNAGRTVGMMCISCADREQLECARREATEASGVIAAMLSDDHSRDAQSRRLRQAELLYELSTVTSGATTPTSLADRALRELREIMPLDHLSMVQFDEGEPMLLGFHGATMKLIDVMSFAGGPGLDGWLNTGAPELVLFDARADARCPSEEALKRRIGSYYLAPLGSGTEPVGYLCAASHRVGGIDVAEVESLRIVASELGRALEALLSDESAAGGVMSPVEFQKHIATTPGSLVVLEVLRREALIESFGSPALSFAVRKLLTRIRARLPHGGAVCLRAQGDYVAYLPRFEPEQATSWANEVSATASMIGILGKDGTSRIPLALRAKVAGLNPQEHELLTNFAA